MFESISTQLYEIQQFANQLVSNQLTQVSVFSVAIIFLTGLLTSLTPCMLSMLPLTIAYIGGYEKKGKLSSFLQSTYFALGLATTLAILGVFAAVLGKVYGQIGTGLPLFVSAIAILMGLNLLEIIPLRFPSWDGTDWIKENVPDSFKSYLLGLTFGLVASPCSTPVLVTLLAYVGSSQNIILSSVFLMSYATGYVSPLILAGTFTGTIKNILNLRQVTQWINPVSGGILILFGVISLSSRLDLNMIF